MGTSAIVLYAQVSNVGVNTYPTVTFTHRKTSVATRTAGNIRNNRIIKDGEIPPNDSLILIDGRLVLERAALASDSIVITGSQTGITTINDVKEYDVFTGLTTVTTQDPHNFSVNDEITMAGIAFAHQQQELQVLFFQSQVAFVVKRLVLANTNFETNTGIVKTLPHTFRPSLHNFIRADKDPITVTSGTQNGNKIQVGKGTSYDSANRDSFSYGSSCTHHNLTTGNTIQFTNESLVFKCSQDNFFQEKISSS